MAAPNGLASNSLRFFFNTGVPNAAPGGATTGAPNGESGSGSRWGVSLPLSTCIMSAGDIVGIAVSWGALPNAPNCPGPCSGTTALKPSGFHVVFAGAFA